MLVKVRDDRSDESLEQVKKEKKEQAACGDGLRWVRWRGVEE